MHGRTPHAAKQLRDQINAKLRRDPEGKAAANTMKPAGDPDGLGTFRTFAFDATASKLLAELLPKIDDPRIVDYSESKKGKSSFVEVTFAPGIVADRRDPFPIDAVDAPDEEPAG